MKDDLKLQVLNLNASGKSNLEISIAIGCTARTVQRILQACRVETAAQQAHDTAKSIQHFQVTESKRVRSLCSSLRTVEQEIASRSFADISTSQLLNIVFKLRHQVQKLEDRNEQLLEKAFKMHEKEFGSEETNDEFAYSEDQLPNQASSSTESTPVQPISAANTPRATATIQKPTPATSASTERNKTILTLLPDPKAMPSTWPTTGKKRIIVPTDHDQYRTPSQAHAHSLIQSAIKSIPPGKATVGSLAHPEQKGERKPLISYMELSQPKLDLTQPLVGSLQYNSDLMEVALSQDFEKQAA